MQADPGGNICRILVLVFQASFHCRQMDQIQHTVPVNRLFRLDGFYGTVNRLIHRLHFVHFLPQQLLLYPHGFKKILLICRSKCHLPDIFQRKSQIF